MKDYKVQIYGTWGLGPKVWAEAGVGGGMSVCVFPGGSTFCYIVADRRRHSREGLIKNSSIALLESWSQCLGLPSCPERLKAMGTGSTVGGLECVQDAALPKTSGSGHPRFCFTGKSWAVFGL